MSIDWKNLQSEHEIILGYFFVVVVFFSFTNVMTAPASVCSMCLLDAEVRI